MAWIKNYGIPFYSFRSAWGKSAADPVVDQVLKDAGEIEAGLYRSFNQYVMLRETFLAFSLEAHLALTIYKAQVINFADIEQYRTIFSPEKFAEAVREAGFTREESEISRFTLLHDILQRRLSGHTSSIYPTIAPRPTEARPFMKYNLQFELPDLLTAMWYQFLEIITRTNNIAICPGCNCFFIPRKIGQTFCNPEPGKTISRCRSKVNKYLHDHPEEKNRQ